MTKTQGRDLIRLSSRVCGVPPLGLGVTLDDFYALLRIEKTLHRWAERECNGEAWIDENGTAFVMDTGSPPARGYGSNRKLYPTANKEAGALRRLAAIMARYPKLASYVQSDPRGCSLYVYEKRKLDEWSDRQWDNADDASVVRERSNIASCYSSVGVAMAV